MNNPGVYFLGFVKSDSSVIQAGPPNQKDLFVRCGQNSSKSLEVIASEMQKEGLDPNNEENLDSYLNSKIT